MVGFMMAMRKEDDMLEEGQKMKNAISWTMMGKDERVIPNSSRGVEDAANARKMTILWGGTIRG